MQTVLVFKTTVTNHNQVKQIRPVLDQLLSPPEKWTFDLEDCDNILRVVAQTLPADAIINTLNQAGFSCEELAD